MVEDAPLATVDTAAIEQRQATIAEAASLMVVDSAAALAVGEGMVVSIKATIKKLHDELDPGIDKANKLHKHLTGQRKKYEDPLKEAQRIAVGKTSTYRADEERKRREEEAKLRAKALKEAEDARLEEAAQLEQVGQTAEAAAVIEEPVKVAPVVVAKTLPKSAVRYTTTWYADVTGLPILIGWAAQSQDRCAYLEGNMTALNAAARSTKGPSHIPGVVFESKTT